MLLLGPISFLIAEEHETESVPTIAFLEYLGEWESDEDELIVPELFESDEIEKLIETVDTDNEN